MTTSERIETTMTASELVETTSRTYPRDSSERIDDRLGTYYTMFGTY